MTPNIQEQLKQWMEWVQDLADSLRRAEDTDVIYSTADALEKLARQIEPWISKETVSEPIEPHAQAEAIKHLPNS